MKSPTLAILVLFGWVMCCHATDRNIYSFSLSSRLQCEVPNPFYRRVPGEPPTRVEDIPRIPLIPGEPGDVWLPQSSTAPLPNFGVLDVPALISFLGDDLNFQLVALTRPSDMAPLARDVLNVEVGSAGELVVVDDEGELVIPGIDALEDTDPDAAAAVREWIMNQELGTCELDATWTLLPPNFFPRYIAGSFCSGESCSFPEGQTCEPDSRPATYVYTTILRWDCCWNYAGRRWRWDCGWRKVSIPFITDCDCQCLGSQRTERDVETVF